MQQVINPNWQFFWDRLVERGLPRDAGIKRYPRVTTTEEYYAYIKKGLQTKESVYVEFYSDLERKTQILDRILIDADREKKDDEMDIFDLPHLEEEWESIRVFCRYFWNYMDVYFSGRKGFHITFYTRPFTLDYRYRKTFREWFRAWLGNPRLLDDRVFLDLRRVISIPMTYHSKTKLLVIPVHYDMNLEDIILRSTNPSDDYLKRFMVPKQRWNMSQLPCICDFL